MTIYDLKKSYQYAMHGVGAYKGLRQTNTLDAFEYWYKKDVRIFELDMAKTSDDKYVAVAHSMDDKSLRRLELFNLPENRTHDWFMQQKLFSISTKGLNPLSLESIVNLLKKYPDVIVMLDLFGMFKANEAGQFTQILKEIIGEKLELWDRLLVEAYNIEMVDGIQAATDKAQVIYCARYEDNIHKKDNIKADEFIGKNIKFISYPWYCKEQHPGEIESYAKSGITVFSRTKFNTKDKKLKSAGVSVNIIAKKFNGIFIIVQLPLYMATYLKRILVKYYIKCKYTKV